ILQSKRTRPVTGVGITSDGRALVAAGNRGYDVYDLSTGASTTFEIPHGHEVFDVAVDPLGRHLYFASPCTGPEGGAWICDLKTGGRRRFGGGGLGGLGGHLDHHVISIAASGDGTRVVLSRGGGLDNRIECWTAAADGSLSLAWRLPAVGQH